jgi:hypothetical protein
VGTSSFVVLSSLSESLIEISWNCFVTSITFRPFTIRGSAGASPSPSFEVAFEIKAVSAKAKFRDLTLVFLRHLKVSILEIFKEESETF